MCKVVWRHFPYPNSLSLLQRLDGLVLRTKKRLKPWASNQTRAQIALWTMSPKGGQLLREHHRGSSIKQWWKFRPHLTHHQLFSIACDHSQQRLNILIHQLFSPIRHHSWQHANIQPIHRGSLQCWWSIIATLQPIDSPFLTTNAIVASQPRILYIRATFKQLSVLSDCHNSNITTDELAHTSLPTMRPTGCKL